ncbi:glycosyltransferase family 4 protein [Candidatus Parcubacteria bacterium]|nr:glycosyltransferase family 4 protein [Patescibacteria group bacterium]MCG2699753.1 glycosyltransferase family 4 protein [Candidatus Parcubacteria bacterium]
MKICLISPIDERIPPILYGGIGRVVYNLTDGLVKKGHDVTLLASGDSNVSDRIIPVINKSLGVSGINNSPKKREVFFQMAIANIINILLKNKFDIISNHLGWRLIPFENLISDPIVTTLHTPLDQENKQILFSNYPNHPVISISKNQRKPLPKLKYLGNVYNGINIFLYDFSDIHDDYLMFLGRMSPEKGVLEAIQIAKKMNMKLVIAGAIHNWDRVYFESKIKQHIDNESIVFVGEINDKEKNKLLGRAKALLAPVQWDEPFGLTFIESMACGTPVVSFNRGSVKEIIIDKKTGIIANSINDICNRFKELDRINRVDCRKHVENKFVSDIMVNNYEEIFLNYLKKINEKNKR